VNEIDILKRKLEREQRARASAEDILEQKSRELYFANKELENDRFTLFENSSVGIALTINGKLINANTRFCSMVGYSLDELKTMSIADISHKEDTQLSYENTDLLQKKEIEAFQMEKRYQRKDGSLFWGFTRVSPVLNEHGKIKYHLAIIEDIQAKKDALRKEEALLQELKRSNTELEAFAQMVSHDLKSPLKGIGTLIHWLKTDYQELYDENGRNNLSEIELRLTKMTNLIDGIMSYTKLHDDVENEQFDLKELVENVVQFVYRPAHVSIKVTGDFPVIHANKHRVHQLFQNLIDNAVKFCNPEKGLVEINANEDESFYIFKVSDNGKGIPSKYHRKIFKIFTTLEKDPSNTGIGLAIVKNIVDQYGGRIFVESEEGQGASFTFTLLKNKVRND